MNNYDNGDDRRNYANDDSSLNNNNNKHTNKRRVARTPLPSRCITEEVGQWMVPRSRSGVILQCAQEALLAWTSLREVLTESAMVRVCSWCPVAWHSLPLVSQQCRSAVFL